MAEPQIDIAALVTDIRLEAERLRATLPPESRAAELHEEEDGAKARVPAAAAVTSRLGPHLDPRAVTLQSHRGRLGTLVVAAKRLLVRLLTPSMEQQAAFNKEVHDTLVDMADAAAMLERRLVIVEDAALRVPGIDEAPFDDPALKAGLRLLPGAMRATPSEYLELFPSSASGLVLDLGCGRGEFLLDLVTRGIAVRGVDHDEGMAAAARAALAASGATRAEVVTADLFDALEACSDGSLGGVTALRVAEQLGVSRVVRLVRTARRKLRSRGVIVLEVPNVASLIVHARPWTIDPTRHQPLHPLALRHIVAHCGFTEVELRFSSPVEPELVLEAAGDGDAAARNFARLNEVLFAPQTYAVVGRA